MHIRKSGDNTVVSSQPFWVFFISDKKLIFLPRNFGPVIPAFLKLTFIRFWSMISKLARMLVENSFPAKPFGLNKFSPLLLFGSSNCKLSNSGE